MGLAKRSDGTEHWSNGYERWLNSTSNDAGENADVNYAALTPTIDIFELILSIVVLIAWYFVYRDTSEGWAEKETALDNPDPVVRRLGTTRYDNARARAFIIVLFTMATGLLLIVPSAIQAQESITEVFSAMGVRVAFIGATLAIIFKIWNDSWWRHYSDGHTSQLTISTPVPPAPPVSPGSPLPEVAPFQPSEILP